ncbi:MAG: hypothetical protein LLG04_17555 [Parachlamydia sp.]|nr:hypothetical protein [Parachlamydia sp.]
MVRISKQSERRAQSPRRPRPPTNKTGEKKSHVKKGFKEHQNALEGEAGQLAFIPKIR